MCNKEIKILFVILLFLLILGISNCVFGFSFDLNETTYNLPEFPFDTEEHSTYIFGYKKRDNCFIVGYPSDAVKNNKIFCSETDQLTDLVFRYYIDGTNKFGQWTWYYINLNNLSTWSDVQSTSPYDFIRFLNTGKLIYSSVDIYESPTSENVFFQATIPFKAPSFGNSLESFELNNFESFIILPGDVSSTEEIRFTIRNNDLTYDIPILDGGSFTRFEELYTFLLNSDSEYYIFDSSNNIYYYSIPKTELYFEIKDNYNYTLLLHYGDDFKYVELNYTTGIPSDEEVILTDLNKTNKNIFQKLGDIFNLLNPLSDQFFLYVALDKLFIPSDNFFNNWLSDFNSWLGDRFGLVYYPIELVLDFLTRIGNIAESDNFIISWPNLDIFGATLIAAGSYDFNSLLLTEEFNNIHEIYLLIMDVIFYLLLVLFAKNVAAEVFGGRFSDEVIGDITSSVTAPERSYKRYVRHQENKKRYRKENGG